ncbi:MAG: SGNH/GDSL hydrolase family protein, partial [Candidatus Binataceae bacterium]
MSLLKRAAANFALICGGIIAALVIIEIGLWAANYWFPYFFSYDVHRGWGLEAGSHGHYDREGNSYVRINAEGFRGPARAKAKPPNVFRVAVLGDSYTEAIQVPYRDTFCAIIQRRLSECPELKGKKIEVLDFGVDGYGTAQELITLREKTWSYSPDAVVLAVFLGNDVRNNSVVLEGDQCRPFYVLKNGELALAGRFVNSSSFRLWCMARFG